MNEKMPNILLLYDSKEQDLARDVQGTEKVGVFAVTRGPVFELGEVVF